jgi:DNA-binding response OmpR family regulator
LATILVVDDEAPIRQVVRRFLNTQHHEIFEAEDGVAALEVLGSHDVDVAIVDLMMPRMDGLELMSRMRVQHAEVKVIVISAFEEIMDLAEREREVVTTLKKPFELTELAEALRMALSA